MIETQATVSDWAAATFGEPSSHARVAWRLAEEIAELGRETSSRNRPAEVADECADAAIILCRLAHRLGIELSLTERPGESGQWMARNLSLSPSDLAAEAMRRCLILLDVGSLVDRVPSLLPASVPPMGSAYRLADVLECLCRQAGTTLQDAVDAKMAVNRKREWKLTGDGHGYHLRDKAAAAPS